MPETTRKAPARKSTAASVAARREVRAAKNTIPPLVVDFRGEKFEIPLLRLGNDRTYNLTVAMQEATDAGERIRYMGKIVRYLIGTADMDRWIGLAKDDELPGTLVVDMMTSINKAGNVPNS